MTRFYSIAFVFAFLIGVGNAANKHVWSGATGSGSGDTWTDAYTTFAAAETGAARGDTIYVAEGTYAGNTWNKAVSGTSVIVIKRATSSEHGSSTGWADTIADGMITITNAMIFSTGFHQWLGGQGSFSRTANATNQPYGFVVKISDTISEVGLSMSPGGESNLVSGVEFIGRDTMTNWTYTAAQYGAYLDLTTNATIRGCLFRGWDTGIYFGTPGGGTIRNVGTVIEDNVIHSLRADAPAHCNVVYCSGVSNVVFRRNYAFNYLDEGFFITGFQAPPINVKVYNNIFSGLGGPGGSLGFPRAVELRPDYSYTNITIHNNTAVSLGTGFTDRTGETGGTCNACVATNNLSYASGNNWGSVAAGSNTDDSTDRFVNRTGLDFSLASALSGATMAAEFATDIDGVAFGTDGTTDQGAIQFGGGDTTPPTVSSVTIAANGTTWTIACNETVTVGAGGNGGFAPTMSGGGVTLTYSSGSGSSSLVYTGSRTVYSGETGTIAYTQPGSGIEDTSGNDLASFSGTSVVNNSTQTQTVAGNATRFFKLKGLRIR